MISFQLQNYNLFTIEIRFTLLINHILSRYIKVYQKSSEILYYQCVSTYMLSIFDQDSDSFKVTFLQFPIFKKYLKSNESALKQCP